MKKSIIIVALLLNIYSCGISSKNSGLKEVEESILAIKFMYSNDYASDLSPAGFWEHPEEQAKLELYTDNGGNFLNRIKALPKADRSSFEFLKYAFIIKHSGTTDTVYADLELNIWMISNSGIEEFYNDSQKALTEDLQRRYGFFKSCW